VPHHCLGLSAWNGNSVVRWWKTIGEDSVRYETAFPNCLISARQPVERIIFSPLSVSVERDTMS
jgi:hypothetical protein